MLLNTVIGSTGDYITQKQQYNNKVANGTASGEFKADVGSMIFAGASAATGTALNIGLTSANTAVEAIVTGVTGGYFGSLAAGAVEMVGRGMYIQQQPRFKKAVKTKKVLAAKSQYATVKCRAW